MRVRLELDDQPWGEGLQLDLTLPPKSAAASKVQEILERAAADVMTEWKAHLRRRA